MLVILLGARFLLTAAPESQGAATAAAPTTANIPPTTSTSEVKAAATAATVKSSPKKTAAAPAANDQAHRIVNPYSIPPLTFDQVNTSARAALVNILCKSPKIGIISGSGVIIDPRGVILTNAHIAQYFLLSDIISLDITCEIRAGAPAYPKWRAAILYFPKEWAQKHAADIRNEHATGTGENDFALLLLTAAISGDPMPAALPYLPFDAREGIAFTGDTMLAAAYPAGFLGPIEAEKDLNPASTIATVGNLYTFSKGVDLFSIGGNILAQGGSSGGAVVNQWGKLVGIIVTSSTGATTAERDLRALAMAHVERSTGGLGAFLSGNLLVKAQTFQNTEERGLVKLFQAALK